ncbi:unnamed protein product [Arctia plantaginis]|uniref:Uncharacterized protein n=1 Tax=Arctia plantaginis TaxID=874455 RepID=A0A8S1A5K7_ARCPL|nr:unnamed protein product [Arctia plantaginis]
MAAKRATKRAVARDRRDHLQLLYDKLESSKEQKLLYELASSRIEAVQAFSKCRCVKDPGGYLLCEGLMVKERCIHICTCF